MAKVTVKLNAERLNWILKVLVGFELPEKIGEKAYDSVQRSICKDECRQGITDLKAYSYWAQQVGEDNRYLFGPREIWDVKRDVKGKIEDLTLNDPAREFEVKLSQDSVSGIMWMLVTIMMPEVKNEKGEVTHRSVPPFIAESFVWPVAEALKKTKAIRSFLKLDTADKKARWDDDEEAPKLLEEKKA
jgi:hypothetical protein